MKHLDRDECGRWHARCGDASRHGRRYRARPGGRRRRGGGLALRGRAGAGPATTTSSSRSPSGPASRPCLLPTPCGMTPKTAGARRFPPSTPASPSATARHSYAVLRGLTSARRRHGGGRDDEPARARRAGPQLRLPLRVDPRPVLRRPGRRPRRAAPPARRRRPVRRRSAPRPTGPTSSPPTRSTAPRCPTNALWTCPATPVAPTFSATTPTASSSSTSSAKRCCCSPPLPTTTTSTATATAPPR